MSSRLISAKRILRINSLHSSVICCLTFANSLDPDQDRQNVGPDLDSNRLTLNQVVFLKEFFKKLILIKSQHTAKKSMKNYACKGFSYHTFRRLNI